MKSHKALTVAVIAVLLLSAVVAASVSAAPLQSGSFSRLIPSGGTTSFQSLSSGTDEVQWPEFAAGDSEEGPHEFSGSIVDRSQSHGSSHGVSANSGKKAKSNPELKVSFDGLNH